MKRYETLTCFLSIPPNGMTKRAAAAQEKLRKMMEKMRKVLSPEKIEQYLLAQMGEREHLTASSLPLEETEDFIKLIYIRLYGQRKNRSYRIEMKEKTEKNGFRFQNFEIWRK